MELFVIMKIITLISFTCEPVPAHCVHAPSPSGRISEPGCGLGRGLQADQGGLGKGTY